MPSLVLQQSGRWPWEGQSFSGKQTGCAFPLATDLPPRTHSGISLSLASHWNALSQQPGGLGVVVLDFSHCRSSKVPVFTYLEDG